MTALPTDNIKFKFVDEVKKLKGRTNSRLNILFKEEYDVLLTEVRDASSNNGPKTPLQYRRLKRFGIVEVGNIEKLVTRNKEQTGKENNEDSNNIVIDIRDVRYVIPVEEMFDILTICHRSIGHGGRDRMKTKMSKQYSNITQGYQRCNCTKFCQNNTCRGKKIIDYAIVSAIKALLVPINKYKYNNINNFYVVV
ncbi:unnamed protein product [Acanthoscelides obtectus]|uniref:Integrase zinc-binding domain-containing protein n=1 Tax=Acanthoscelides obtectus TaxID=200917 RepID=A0A9P0LYE3_ACAOB|nr:unnamed protein product [Acanthoscelides obtectus]CAK1655871.1 KRAB-A domain-containing protein 2 [Acanthoscelides obtectus]